MAALCYGTGCEGLALEHMTEGVGGRLALEHMTEGVGMNNPDE